MGTGWSGMTSISTLVDGWWVADATGVAGSCISLHSVGYPGLTYLVVAEFHEQQEKDKPQCISIF